MKIVSRKLGSGIVAMLLFVTSISGAQVTRTASGANAAAIQSTVDQFKADLGGANNGVGGSFTTGRREINWDGVPDAFASPNNLPVDFFNVNSPRGMILDSGDAHFLRVSASLASGTAVRFGDIDASYSSSFQTFSPERLFAVVDTTLKMDPQIINIVFFIPGTKIPATVSGFGAVIADVDNGCGIIFYGVDGKRLGTPVFAPAANNGLSFAGASFNAGERIARIEIRTNGYILAPGNADPPPDNDSVAFDDFIYGEPRADQYHSGDFDGDGTSDLSVFRPSTGQWFILNSGSNTFTAIPFGTNGDIPIDGDFDGDQRADAAIYRPSSGVWFFLRSSNGTTLGATFGGVAGDKPVPADYDKDGKTDIAFWRPSTGNYFVLRSSDNFTTFFGAPWGANGDIPIQTAGQ